MNSETRNGTTPTPSVLKLLLTTVEALHRTDPSAEKADPLPIVIALICIFLLLATCVSFIALCNPAGLDASRYGPYECMPYHRADSSEPRLKLWKRLDSLRRSVSGFRRTRSLAQPQQTFTGHGQVDHTDSDLTESTKM
uniref:uncharacterized protein C10orf105-like n=1 Tax=Pristiophorus japonicus TaxID=55135 RepID=UPI00398F10C0